MRKSVLSRVKKQEVRNLAFFTATKYSRRQNLRGSLTQYYNEKRQKKTYLSIEELLSIRKHMPKDFDPTSIRTLFEPSLGSVHYGVQPEALPSQPRIS